MLRTFGLVKLSSFMRSLIFFVTCGNEGERKYHATLTYSLSIAPYFSCGYRYLIGPTSAKLSPDNALPYLGSSFHFSLGSNL